jgi:serine/threonine protein kinase
MGDVYLAQDEQAAPDSPSREVAVKIVRRQPDGLPVTPDEVARSSARFAREVRIMNRLEHPNLVRTITGGVDSENEDLPYLAMEFLSGITLANLIDEHVEGLPVAWAAAVGAQIAAGLAAAHRAGIVHRDLKPSNAMLLHGGIVKVLDFGVGLIVDDLDTTRLTSTGVAIGTARYMSPEQAQGRAATSATDLYALGCVLYDLLVGTPPFDGASSYDLQYKHVHQAPTPVGVLRAGIPAEFDALVGALLAKRPTDRPGSIEAVRDTLTALALVPSDERVPLDPEGFDPTSPLRAVAEEARAVLAAQAAYRERRASTGSGTFKDEAGHNSPRERMPHAGMDIFTIHGQLIKDYRAFTQGSAVIRDDRIADFVEQDLKAKSQWPDPWLSLNPFFASGGTVTELVREGVLHPECGRIFQAGKREGSTVCDGRPLTLHRHQREAVEAAQTGASYVLTTGTGSGKSLAYIVPIVDAVLKARQTDSSKKVRAIIVYPMNALANSQRQELSKFLRDGYGEGHEPVTFARYTGQESQEERDAIRNDPPDILLTNYVMLELMLTRPDDRKSLIKMAKGLEFLVFDELHTYRGRQGADVAMLIRRVRDACQTRAVQCVGTSATMSTEGTFEDQKAVVAQVASTLFGTEVSPKNVIGETLVRGTEELSGDVPAVRLTAPTAPRGYADLVCDSLASWIESTFGLVADQAGGRLVRQRPETVEHAATLLAEQSGVSEDECALAIRRTLEAGSQARDPETDRPLFAFRLHQFLSKGDTVYVTLEEELTRHLTRDYQLEQPNSGGKILLPLAFCRECGQEYLTVWRNEDRSGDTVYQPRRDTVATGGKGTDGYLYISQDRPWPRDAQSAIGDRRLPESWLEVDERGQEVVKRTFRSRMPQPVTVDPFGTEGRGDLEAAYIPSPFLFCLRCGVSYEQTRGRDFAKLATLDQEGRSSATSLISASIVRSLKAVPAEELDPRARKLLTFVDNRQDASLQAGHFNDFVQITQLRGALYRAARDAGDEGLDHEQLAGKVSDALALDPIEYAREAGQAPSLAKRAATTLRELIAFRLYLDLERGWRVTMPNLEQTGLLRIDYADLNWLAAQQDRWASAHPALSGAESGKRAEIMRTVLDEMRRGLAIDVACFNGDAFDALRNGSEARLIDPWVLAEGDRPRVGTAYPQGSRPGMDRSGLFLSGRGKVGKYLRRKGQFPHLRDASGTDLGVDEAQQIISELLEVMAGAGLLTKVAAPTPQYGRGRRGPSAPAVRGYRVAAGALIWHAGDGTSGALDPLARTFNAEDGPRVNPFFRDLYRDTAGTLSGLSAREHTAQVAPADREQREEDFREAKLKLLYCSPTMELGVDISSLNAVSMRNVPPTPANSYGGSWGQVAWGCPRPWGRALGWGCVGRWSARSCVRWSWVGRLRCAGWLPQDVGAPGSVRVSPSTNERGLPPRVVAGCSQLAPRVAPRAARALGVRSTGRSGVWRCLVSRSWWSGTSTSRRVRGRWRCWRRWWSCGAGRRSASVGAGGGCPGRRGRGRRVGPVPSGRAGTGRAGRASGGARMLRRAGVGRGCCRSW